MAGLGQHHSVSPQHVTAQPARSPSQPPWASSPPALDARAGGPCAVSSQGLTPSEVAGVSSEATGEPPAEQPQVSQFVTGDANVKQALPVRGRQGPRDRFRPPPGDGGKQPYFHAQEPREGVDAMKAPWDDEWRARDGVSFPEAGLLAHTPAQVTGHVEKMYMTLLGAETGAESSAPGGTSSSARASEAKKEVEPGAAALLMPTGTQSFQALPRAGFVNWAATGGIPRSGVRKEEGMVGALPPHFQGASKYMQLGIGNPVHALQFQAITFPSAQYNFSRLSAGTNSGPGLPALNYMMRADEAPVGAADNAKVPLHAARRAALRELFRNNENGGGDTTLRGVVALDDMKENGGAGPSTGLKLSDSSLGEDETRVMKKTHSAISFVEKSAGAVFGGLVPPPKAATALTHGQPEDYIETAAGRKAAMAMKEDLAAERGGARGGGGVRGRSGTVYGFERYNGGLVPDNSKPVLDFRFLTPRMHGAPSATRWYVPSREQLNDQYLCNTGNPPEHGTENPLHQPVPDPECPAPTPDAAAAAPAGQTAGSQAPAPAEVDTAAAWSSMGHWNSTWATAPPASKHPAPQEQPPQQPYELHAGHAAQPEHQSPWHYDKQQPRQASGCAQQ